MRSVVKITDCKQLQTQMIMLTTAEGLIPSIRDFAYACDYVPGMFAELVYPKFLKGKDIL